MPVLLYKLFRTGKCFAILLNEYSPRLVTNVGEGQQAPWIMDGFNHHQDIIKDTGNSLGPGHMPASYQYLSNGIVWEDYTGLLEVLLKRNRISKILILMLESVFSHISVLWVHKL